MKRRWHAWRAARVPLLAVICLNAGCVSAATFEEEDFPIAAEEMAAEEEMAEEEEAAEEVVVAEEEEPMSRGEEESLAAMLGSVWPDSDVVNHGLREGQLVQLRREEDLHDGDRLDILRGGVALVSLDIGWEFVLFNGTRMGVELRETETVADTMLMENGTLLGRRRVERAGGDPVIFPLPGNRSITVIGTTFFIILDGDTGQAAVGNFDGTIEVEGDGVSLSLPSGRYLTHWWPNESPALALQERILFSPDEFEAWGRELGGPVPVIAALCVDDSEYVTDVTIPDGTEVEPAESFTKTWRLQNSGSCTWTGDYELAFNGGDRMSGPSGVALPRSVEPGETIDVSVSLVAPVGSGWHEGNWQLVDEAGDRFGEIPYVSIFVETPDVEVIEPAPIPAEGSADTTPPPAPVLFSPGDGATFTSCSEPVTLEWSEPSDSSGISKYYVELWVYDESTGYEVFTYDFISGTFGTFYDFWPPCVEGQTDYWWRVVAYDGANNVGDFSDYRQFLVWILA